MKTRGWAFEGLAFEDALVFVKGGDRVRRAGWNGKGMWLALVAGQQAGESVDVRGERLRLLPWIGMRTADGNWVPWLASQTDLLASDWEVLS